MQLEGRANSVSPPDVSLASFGKKKEEVKKEERGQKLQKCGGKERRGRTRGVNK